MLIYLLVTGIFLFSPPYLQKPVFKELLYRYVKKAFMFCKQIITKPVLNKTFKPIVKIKILAISYFCFGEKLGAYRIVGIQDQVAHILPSDLNLHF